MIRKLTLGSALAMAMAVGCAHEPTSELTAARNAYEKAAQGQAAQLAPAKVWEAKQALTKAEMEFQEDPGSHEERDLAYIALRKANLATAYANMKAAEDEERNAKKNYGEVLETQRDHTRVALDQSESELEQTQDSLQTRQQELQEARQAQAQLERQLGVALGSLQEMAKVDRDPQDRTVITLDGEVLFAFGKSQLLPTAERRLEKVAKVLSKYNDSGQKIVIEGHTDSVGSDSYNQELSRQRAQAVADFLARNGVNRSILDTVGRGETQPLATNDSPEGRANNRRVELIIEDPNLRIDGGPTYQGQGPDQGQQRQRQQGPEPSEMDRPQ